jgi:Ca2+-binding RTX toxin-like protein
LAILCGANPNNTFFFYSATNNLAYSGAGPNAVPLSGTVTSFELHQDGGSGSAELTITDLSLDFALLAPLEGSLTNDQEANLIWRLLLAGDDTIDLGANTTTNGLNLTFAADGRHVEDNQTLTGGNDTITGDAGDGQVSGDYRDVSGLGQVFGGSDTLTVLNADRLLGDAADVYGLLWGGDDTLSIATGGDVLSIAGDAFAIQLGGTVFAGNDTLDASFASADVFAVGDAGYVYGGALVGGDDSITGSTGDDFLWGDAALVETAGSLLGGDDTLLGGNGDDTLFGDWELLSGFGFGGDDVLFGDAGHDTIHGNGGNDEIHGGADTDEMLGGDGDDAFVIDAEEDVQAGEIYSGGDGTDTLKIGSLGIGYLVDFRSVALTSIEALVYGASTPSGIAAVFLNASQFGAGLSLTASVTGNANSAMFDRLNIDMDSAGALNLREMDFSSFGDVGDYVSISGDSGGELIEGSGVNDSLDGGEGSDTLTSNLGNDTLRGGADGDQLQIFYTLEGGTTGAQLVTGEFDGGGGTDILYLDHDPGFFGNYDIDLSSATLLSLEKVQTYSQSDGQTATIRFAASQFGSGGVSLGADFYVHDNNANAAEIVRVAMGSVSSLNLSGLTFTGFSDAGDRFTITGDGSAETVTGTVTADSIVGSGGRDTLNGGLGKDTLVGGTGKDRLTGGNQADAFRFDKALGSSNVDTISDFKTSQGDTIQLDDAIFGAIGASLTASEFRAVASGNVAANNVHIVYDRSSGKLWYDADDNGSGAAIHFATLTTKPSSLSFSDFVIV